MSDGHKHRKHHKREHCACVASCTIIKPSCKAVIPRPIPPVPPAAFAAFRATDAASILVTNCVPTPLTFGIVDYNISSVGTGGYDPTTSGFVALFGGIYHFDAGAFLAVTALSEPFALVATLTFYVDGVPTVTSASIVLTNTQITGNVLTSGDLRLAAGSQVTAVLTVIMSDSIPTITTPAFEPTLSEALFTVVVGTRFFDGSLVRALPV